MIKALSRGIGFTTLICLGIVFMLSPAAAQNTIDQLRPLSDRELDPSLAPAAQSLLKPSGLKDWPRPRNNIVVVILPADELGFTGPWLGFGNHEIRFPRRNSSIPVTIVNTLNGNQILAYRDLAYPGEDLRFNFIRVFNSLDFYIGPLGLGWTHTYNVFLQLDEPGIVYIKEADGRQIKYAKASDQPGDGSTIFDPVTQGIFDLLVKQPDGTFVLTRKNHNKLYFSTAGQLTSIADQNGRRLKCDYTDGNLTRITDPEGRIFNLAYDQDNQLTQLTDEAGGRVLKYAYDDGLLTSYVDPLGGLTTYVYDSSGHLIEAIQQNGESTFKNTYDSLGRVATQQNPEGGLTDVETYGAAWSAPTVAAAAPAVKAAATTCAETTGCTTPPCKATTFTDPLGRQTTHVYDAKSRLVRIIDALGGITGYEYDNDFNRISVTDPLCHTTDFTYDSRGNMLTLSDAEGRVSTFTYDGHDNRLTSMNGRGTVTTFGYDGNNNLTLEKDGLGNETAFSYDASGRLLALTDANGHTTLYSYDAVGNLLEATDAKGNITTYDYDDQGNRTSVTNAKLNATLYVYDSLDRLTKVTDPLQNVTIYSHDGVGNVLSMTDPYGRTITYKYSGLNRVEKITYPDGSDVENAYDAVGNRLSMKDSSGITNYTYDALNRPKSITRPGQQTVQYSYDEGGNRTALSYPDGKTVSYGYDRTNRMTGVTDWLTRVSQYGYDAAGNMTSIQHANGTSSAFTYDGADRLIQIRNEFQGGDKNSIPLTNYQYTLDAVGNRTQVTDGSGQAIVYAYDELDQLVNVVAGNDSASYAYDSVGNRVSISPKSKHGAKAYTYDAADRMLTAGDAAFTYDKNGNRTERQEGKVTTSYAYDAANRLISVDANNTFEYDGDGNRVAQTVNGNRYDYVNDTAGALTNVLQETGPDGPISYVHGRSLISETGADFTFYYLNDCVKSTVGLTDSSGRRKQRYTYDAWGVTISSIPSPGVGTKNKFQFTGEAHDPGTGLYYLRSRYYDPETGRFLTKDTSSGSPLIPISFNPYIYVRNNPLKYIDPSGRDGEPPWDLPPDPGAWPFFNWPY